MILIPGQLYLELEIDGVKVGDAANLVHTVALVEGVTPLFPSAMLVLNDHSGILSKRSALTDGNSIKVTIGKRPDDVRVQTRQYRLYDQPKGNGAPTGSVKTLTLIYDAPKFVTESSTKTYRGTSDDVLRQIADECKLFYSGCATTKGRAANDFQKWMNVAQSRASFVRMIAQHGWMDKHSAMSCSLTSLGELRYRNLVELMETPLDKIRTHIGLWAPESQQPNPNVTYYRALDSVEKSESGLTNNWMNYGSSKIAQSLDGSTPTESSVDVRTNGKYLAVNDQVSQSVTRARHDFGFIDCGNTHEKFERAAFQNIKQLALFSQFVHVLLTEVTELQLYDLVVFRQNRETPTAVATVSDIYIVLGKTMFVKGGRQYCEKLVLGRPTVTEKGNSVLKSATDPGALLYAAVPESNIDPTALDASKKTIVTVTSVVQKLANLEASARSIRTSALGLLTAAKNIKSVMSGLDVTDLPSAVRALSNANGALSQYAQSRDYFNGCLERTGLDYDTFTSSVSDQPEAVRTASVLRPNGVFQNCNAAYAAVSVDKDVTGSLNTVVKAIQSPAGTTLKALGLEEQAKAVTAQVDQLGGLYLHGNSELARLWNKQLYHLTSETPLATVKNLNYLESTIDGALLPPSYEAKVKSASDLNTEVMRTMTMFNDDRSRRYVDPAGFKVPVVSSTKETGQDLGRKISLAESQLSGVEKS